MFLLFPQTKQLNIPFVELFNMLLTFTLQIIHQLSHICFTLVYLIHRLVVKLFIPIPLLSYLSYSQLMRIML